MADGKTFNRSLSRLLSFGAFIGCFIMAVNIYTALKPYLDPLPILKHFHIKSMDPTTISKFSNSRTDVCEINGDVRIHGASSTIYIPSSSDHNTTSWNIKPYPRKDNFGAMSTVTNFKIITKAADKTPPCNRNLTIPAILFSTGGLAGNHFHAFADVLIPLFLTSHHFNGTTILLATDHNPEWTSHYGVIMEKLSEYNVYDIDKENEVLCFSRMIVGLKAHNDTEIVPSESGNFSRRDFLKLLQLERASVHDHRNYQPRMLIISRQRSRKILNEREIADISRSLGFTVVVKEMPWDVSQVAQLVNSFDVLVGVHGAGISNLVFLPENAVLIQIVPFGVGYLAKVCYEGALESNKLKYLRYDVSLNESSLLGKYPRNSKVYRNPKAISMDFNYFRSVYLDDQDVRVDLIRFRETLVRALELVAT